MLLITTCCFAPSVFAQKPQDEIACRAERKNNAAYKKKLWDGYEISLGPARNSLGGGDDACTAAIYNQAGKVVFRTTGFNVVFDENVTGQDFDGDGKPEVVFRTDTGGGNHCCWGYIVFSLYPKPRKLFEIAMEGKVDFERDKQGRMVIWKRTAGPADFTSMAGQPFAEKVLRVRDGKLVDATPEFCGRIFSEENEDYRIEQRVLTPENLKKLQISTGKEIEDEEIVSTLLSRALQYVFCHQYDEALRDLDQWPEASRKAMKASFAVSIRDDYPEFAAKLGAKPPR